MLISDIINEIASEASKKKKELLLKQYESYELKDILLYTYNSFWTFGIKKIDNTTSEGDLTVLENWFDIRDLLLKLIRRELTGNAAKDKISELMAKFTFSEQDIIRRIINRDMEAGFSESTINRVWQNHIPVFDVALAERYDKAPELLTFDSTWFCSRKCDGCRCIAIVDIRNCSIKFHSRQGIEFTTLRNVATELMALASEAYDREEVPNMIVFDGEICLVDKNGKEDFQGIMKQIKKKDHTIKNPMYLVFDYLTYDEFIFNTGDKKLGERLEVLNNIISKDSTYIKVLEQAKIDSEETFAEWNKKVATFGWEGLILRKNAPYKSGRTKDMLKVKSFFDAEYKVLETINGEFNYSVADEGQVKEVMMTAVIIEHKGYTVKVGSGWSINQRKKFFANPELIVGKTINVQYFEETVNKDGGMSLRFPTVKFIYENGRDT